MEYRKVEMTFGQVMNSVNGLNQLGQARFGPALAYKLGVIMRKVDDQISAINVGLTALREKYGVKVGAEIDSLPDGFMKDRDEYLSETVEINVPTISLEEFGEEKISPVAMAGIYYFIKDS